MFNIHCIALSPQAPPLHCQFIYLLLGLSMVYLDSLQESAVELKELGFFLIFIVFQALINAPMHVDSENL